MKPIVFFQIGHGNGTINGKNGNHSFTNAAQAIAEATEFKNNPRCHNPRMSDDNVKYWQSQTFEIIKTVKSTEIVATI